MDVRGARARSMRKPRRAEGAAKAKAARPAAAARATKPRHVQRVIKTQPVAPPAPANDTLPEGLPALPEEELEIEAVGVAREDEAVDGEETLAVAPQDATDDAAEEEEEEEEVIEGASVVADKRRKAEDEPASFLAMYFRDMAELDVLRPEQEFETARNIEQLELELWRAVLAFAAGRRPGCSTSSSARSANRCRSPRSIG